MIHLALSVVVGEVYTVGELGEELINLSLIIVIAEGALYYLYRVGQPLYHGINSTLGVVVTQIYAIGEPLYNSIHFCFSVVPCKGILHCLYGI